MTHKEYIELGSAPHSENCAQTIDNDFHEKNVQECIRYKSLLAKTFFETFNRQHLCLLVVKSYTHDFGSYREVCAAYSEDNELQAKDAYWFDANCPDCWGVDNSVSEN